MQHSVLRRLFLKQVLGLPNAILRLMSGGGVIHLDGYTLDPQIQFLWHTYLQDESGDLLSLKDKTIEQARQDWRDVASLLGLRDDTRVHIDRLDSNRNHATTPQGQGANTQQIPNQSPARYSAIPVSGLLFRPQIIDPAMPLLVFYPEGFGALGGSELSQSLCALLAHHAHCPIFMPDCRLSPDHRYPAGFDDARLSFEWAHDNLSALGATEIAIGGVSLGANWATRLCLDLRREFKPLPKAQLLVTPLLDLGREGFSDNQDSMQDQSLWPISQDDITLLINAYLGADSDPGDVRLSPLRESVLSGLPRALIASGGLDPLAQQGESFAKRLMSARVETIYRRYDTMPYGFGLFCGMVEQAKQAVTDMANQWVQLIQSRA